MAHKSVIRGGGSSSGHSGSKGPSVKVGKPAAVTQTVHCPHCGKSFQLPISIGKGNGSRKRGQGPAATFIKYLALVLLIIALVVWIASSIPT